MYVTHIIESTNQILSVSCINKFDLKVYLSQLIFMQNRSMKVLQRVLDLVRETSNNVYEYNITYP
jgi:hypothetical protein